MIYLALFWRFFQIGLFSFGGGYAVMPLIRHQIVEGPGWLSLAELSDLIAISQMTPGPVAINAATFTGFKVAGLPGALVATLACILPSCLVVLLLAMVYTRCRRLSWLDGVLSLLRVAVVVLVAVAWWTMWCLALWHTESVPYPDIIASLDGRAAGVFVGAFFVLRRWRQINPVWVILASGAMGIVLYGVWP